MRAAFPCLAMFALAGCVRPDLATCGKRTCPEDTTCVAALDVCASPAALAACQGMADGTPCSDGSIAGACDMGVCVASSCGDGLATGREQCDGADLVGQTCGDYGFYYGTLACKSDCLLDTAGCSGRCGDGIVQSDKFEQCDMLPPPYSCVDRGFDYGHMGCTNACTDSSATACGYFSLHVLEPQPPQEFVAATGGIADVDVIGPVVVYAAAGGLVVSYRGIPTTFPGEASSAVVALPADPGVAGDVDHVYVAVGSNLDEVMLDATGQPTIHLEQRATASGPIAGLAADKETRAIWIAASDSSGCEVNAFDATTNTPVPAMLASSSACATRHAIVLAGTTPYVLAGDGSVTRRDPVRGWVPAGITATRLNSGSAGHVLAITSSGLVELDETGLRHDITVFAPGLAMPVWNDAVAIGANPVQYVAVGLDASNIHVVWRIADSPAPLKDASFALSWPGASVASFRRLGDGHVVVWGDTVSLIDPIAASPNLALGMGAHAYDGVRATASDGFYGWSTGAGTGVDGTPTLFDVATGSAVTLPVAISDLSVANTALGDFAFFAANATGQEATGYWTAGGMLVQFATGPNAPPTPGAISGTYGAVITAVVIDGTSVPHALYRYTAPTTSQSMGTWSALSGPPGDPEAIYAASAQDVYIATKQTTQMTLYHSQGSTWSPIGSAVDGAARHLDLLADGKTLVLSGTRHVEIIENFADPNMRVVEAPLDVGADSATGTSPSDVWLRSSSTVLHYDGATVAPVALPGQATPVGLAATASQVVLIAAGTSAYKLVRFDFDLPGAW